MALSYAPNVNVAILSAGRLIKLLDRIPAYFVSSSESSFKPVLVSIVFLFV